MAAILILAGVALAEKVERRREQKRSYDDRRYAELQRETARRLSASGKEEVDLGIDVGAEDAASSGVIEGAEEKKKVEGDLLDHRHGGMSEGDGVIENRERTDGEEGEVSSPERDEMSRERIEAVQRSASGPASEGGKGKKRWSKVLRLKK